MYSLCFALQMEFDSTLYGHLCITVHSCSSADIRVDNCHKLSWIRFSVVNVCFQWFSFTTRNLVCVLNRVLLCIPIDNCLACCKMIKIAFLEIDFAVLYSI